METEAKKEQFDSQSIRPIFEIPSHLSALVVSLEKTNKNSEPKILRIGQELRSISSASKEVEQLTTESAKLLGQDSDDSILNTIDEFAKMSLKELKTNQNLIYQSYQNGKDVVKKFKDLHKACGMLERISSRLTIIGLNISIKSSYSPEAWNMFEGFAKENKQLAEKIIEISRNIGDDSDKAETNQTFVYKEIATGLDWLQKLVNDTERNTQEIEQLLSISQRALNQIIDSSHRISRQVNNIVVAMQFHDITCQQVEQIIEALKEAEKYFEKNINDINPSESEDENLSHIYSILNLQAEQLIKVISKINVAHERNNHAFQEISIEVEKLTSSVAGSEKDMIKEKSASDPFAALKLETENLTEHLHATLDKGRELSAQIHSMSKEVTETTSQLSNHVEKVLFLSQDLRVKAFNAIIMAEDLGTEGKIFEILAQEVNTLSKQTNEIVDMIVEIIETIISKAQELGVEFEARGYKSIINDDNRMPSQDIGFQIISQAYDRFNRASSEAFLKSKAMQTSILQTRTDLGFLNELAGQHTKHLNEIEEMIQLLTNWAEVKKIDIDDSSIASTVVFEKSEDEDDLDDSIELF